MRRARRRIGLALVALFAPALFGGACGKDKTTALDIELTVSGTIDQVRIDDVTLEGAAVTLVGEQRLFPSSPRMLKTGDVLTVWFADSADAKAVVVTATGLRCGQDVSAQRATAPKALAKGQTVKTTLALDATLTVTCGSDGGAGTTGGRGGAGGTAGAGGSAGAGGNGTGGTTGAGGSAGAAGSAGTGGAAGAGGSAARGGAGGGGGSAGTGGAAGRGGTTGTAGAGGAAGRGGTTGTGGAAGRGGTTGSAGTGGAAGRGGNGGGGTTGTGGVPGGCATAPVDAMAQAAGLTQQPSCGYPLAGAGDLQYLLTGSDRFALASPLALANGANCGRCVELTYTSGSTTTSVTVTVVGGCDAATCPNQNFASFGVSTAAFQVLTQNIQAQLPMPGTTLKYSFVSCPLPANQPAILGNVKAVNGTAGAILFVQQRYGISAVSMTDLTTNVTTTLARGNDNYWTTASGTLSSSGSNGVVSFRLTDVNNAVITIPQYPLLNTAMFSSTSQQFPACPLP